MDTYVEKEFFIIEKDSKKLSILPNDVKLIICVVDQLETGFWGGKHSNFLCSKHHGEISHTV